jgi:membrane fusion protein, heavy metal efflux system
VYPRHALRLAISAGLPVLARAAVLAVLVMPAVLAGCKSSDKPLAAAEATAPGAPGAAGAEHKPEGIDVQLSGPALEAAALKTGKPRLGTHRVSLTAAGRIEFPPSRVARVGPTTEGRVTLLRVEPGQRVTKGAALATIVSADVGRVRGDLLAARTRLKSADLELAREKELIDHRLSTERALVAAETERALSQLGVQTAQERLRALGASGGGADRSSGSSMSLTSPLAGSVLEVHARLGQVVGPSDTLFVVGEIDVLWLVIDVYERDLSGVHVGDAARVTALAFPDRVFEGKVDYIAQTVSPERRAIEARVVLANPDGALRPGMSAVARVLSQAGAAGAAGATGAAGAAGATGAAGAAGMPNAAASNQVLSVPRAAVSAIDGQPYVFVERSRGAFELRAIEPGPETEGMVEVMRGLGPDDVIVTDGAFILKSEFLREQMGKND